jgi:hypothetical protein
MSTRTPNRRVRSLTDLQFVFRTGDAFRVSFHGLSRRLRGDMVDLCRCYRRGGGSVAVGI